MKTEKFAGIFEKHFSDLGGAFLNLKTWGDKRCDNANDLPVGIYAKVGAQSTIGYPADAISEWGLLITVKVSGDFTQIFISHHGIVTYIRGGAQSQVNNIPWYKYNPAAGTVAPAV